MSTKKEITTQMDSNMVRFEGETNILIGYMSKFSRGHFQPVDSYPVFTFRLVPLGTRRAWKFLTRNRGYLLAETLACVHTVLHSVVMEEMAILRLPEGVDAGAVRGVEPHEGALRVLIGDEYFPAKAMSLASAVEVHHPGDGDAVLKRADVGQIIHVFRTEKDMMAAADLAMGLTAPMQRRKTTQTTLSDQGFAKILEEMLLGGGETLEEYAIVDRQPWMRDGQELKLGHSAIILENPELFFSLPKEEEEEEEEEEDEDWMVDSDEDSDEEESVS